MAQGETTHHYGMNLGQLLRRRIDLMERFGEQYRIEFDPVYSAKHRPRAS